MRSGGRRLFSLWRWWLGRGKVGFAVGEQAGKAGPLIDEVAIGAATGASGVTVVSDFLDGEDVIDPNESTAGTLGDGAGE